MMDKKILNKKLLESEVKDFDFKLQVLEKEMDSVKNDSFSYVYNFKIYKKFYSQKVKKEDKQHSLYVHINTIHEMIVENTKKIE